MTIALNGTTGIVFSDTNSIKINTIQVGQSGTATNNFTLYQPTTPDGTIRLGSGNAGATTSDLVTVRSDGNILIGSTVNDIGKLQVSGMGTVARFTGSGGTFAGIGVKASDASASNYRAIFYDALNENSIPVANMLCDVNTDGSSQWAWSTSPAGSRTSDRRVERFRIGSDGTTTLGGNLTLAGAWGTNQFQNGTGDGATSSTYNVGFKLWWGLAYKRYDDLVTRVLDARTGLYQSMGVSTTSAMLPAYDCRAWGNFYGSGSISRRADANISSIARNGTGNYTVNFSTWMPDANYSVVVTTSITTGTQGNVTVNNQSVSVQNLATSSFGITVGDNNTEGSQDSQYVCFAVFR